MSKQVWPPPGTVRAHPHLGGDCRGGCPLPPCSRRCTSRTSLRWAAIPPSASCCSKFVLSTGALPPPPHRACSMSAAVASCTAAISPLSYSSTVFGVLKYGRQ